MLKRLHLKNFTVFADADFEFSSGLNVLVGTNGTGKSHVLKVGYAVGLAYSNVLHSKEEWMPESELAIGTDAEISKQLTEAFLSKDLRNLVRRVGISEKNWPTELEVQSVFEEASGKLDFTIRPFSSTIHRVAQVQSPVFGEKTDVPVFIPAKEMLSLMPGLIGISDRYSGVFDSTYINLARLLVVPDLKELPPYIKRISEEVESIFQGRIEAENGRFYLVTKEKGKFEIPLVAEGYRKIGTLIYLLLNGSIDKNTTLYWDEPEANLNPALLRKLTAILAELARQGFQIILATHSMSLLKEFHILSRQKDAQPLPIKYFGLNARPGYATTIVTTDNFEYLPDVVALEVELEQADDLEEIFVREDRERHADNRRAE